MRIWIVVFLAVATLGCSPKKKPSADSAKRADALQYGRNLHSTVRIMTTDQFNQKLADGYAVYVAPDVVVTSLNWVRGAFRAKMMPVDSRATFGVYGFAAVDADAGIVALRVEKRSSTFAVVDSASGVAPDSLYSLAMDGKRCIKSEYTVDSLMRLTPAIADHGRPLFARNGNLAAIVADDGKIFASAAIAKLVSQISATHKSIYDLRLESNKVYPPASTINGCRIVTSMGNITISLSDKTPVYRDNFIRLVCDNFYDSLLVHRVLTDFLIQMGAADSRHAKADDVVGWQGPGYTLPMAIRKDLYHCRGAVSASKLPDDRNPHNRSDGSQFFIISGRVFDATELDKLESEKHVRFTAEQRQVYTSVGGAPYLDGDYTVFGHVTAGMDVVDRIAAVPLNGDRPQTDIRIRRIELIRK